AENEKAIKDEQKAADEMYKKQKSAIEDAKKADLKAIEERKKAALGDYDARIKAIDALIAKETELNSDADYETKLAEKRARLALLESAVGPEGIKEREDIAKEIERMQLEHDRELRKRELESQKQAIQDEKSEREQAFEKEKSDVEAKYEALKVAFDDFSGDVKTIESAISEFRIQSNEETNATILSNLDTFVSQYNAKMSQIQSMSAH
ncbi:transglycosylase, partial [Paenibacillus alvei]|nr:transglycosylase [Paenibacillus alvei]MCY9588399.1 transglycosylase [Paenibacillus alvei]